jgi:hypothetical protein
MMRLLSPDMLIPLLAYLLGILWLAMRWRDEWTFGRFLFILFVLFLWSLLTFTLQSMCERWIVYWLLDHFPSMRYPNHHLYAMGLNCLLLSAFSVLGSFLLSPVISCSFINRFIALCLCSTGSALIAFCYVQFM